MTSAFALCLSTNAQRPLRVEVSKPDAPSLALWSTTQIPVCWELGADKYSEQKEWVRSAIARTWEKATDLRFTGWCPCRVNMPGIHIRINNSSGPRTNYFGNLLDGKPDGMILNLALTNWGSGIAGTYFNGNKRGAIEAIAVHEFGHALGLSHQQLRDSCFLCDIPNVDIPRERCNVGDSAVNVANLLWRTPCDQFSVMNYCINKLYFNQGELSEADVENIQVFYPHASAERASMAHSLSIGRIVIPMKDTCALKRGLQRKGYELAQEPHLQKLIQEQDQKTRRSYAAKKCTWYSVRLFIEGPDSVLDSIKDVSYYLDPTMFSGCRTIRERSNNFLLAMNVWGRFPIQAIVHRTDGSEIRLYTDMPEIKPIIVDVTWRWSLKDGMRQIRKLVTLDSKLGSQTTTPTDP